MAICWKPAWCECPDCGPLVYVPAHTHQGDPMRDKPLTAAEEAAETRLEERAEDAKWERERGGTDSDSDRDCDRYERYLDDLGPTT